jgi:cation transport regulator
MNDLQTRPYTGPGDDSLPAGVKALPDHAKAIWVAAFNSAHESWDSGKTDQTQEGYAFAVGWAAVKKQYQKDADGNWTKRSGFEAAGHLTKVWRSGDGQRHWRATVMDDGVDCYATRMTTDFQDDVCARAAAGAAGMPWLGVAHFGRESQIGETTRLYRDGRVVKAEGIFLAEPATALQRELVEAAWASAFKEADLLPAHRSICTSQAFYPEAHIVEDCGVLGYTRGRMDHIALTVRPGNSRADFGVEEANMRSSTQGKKSRRELRREDAASIVGEDLAGRLDQANRAADTRSVEDDGLQYRMYAVGAGADLALEVSADGQTWQDLEPYIRAMVPTHKPPLNDPAEAWDAAAARSGIWDWATTDADFDAKKARQGFAIYDSDNPDNKTGMALPHHVVTDSKLITHQRGVMAAGNVTMGARGGVAGFQTGDNEKAQTHLGVHYDQMKRTPPWQRQESSLRHWAEAMEEVEELAAAALLGRTDADVANARAFLQHRLGDGTITLPTLAEAVQAFAGDVALGGALLRATGEADFADAIRAVVSDPDSVGSPAPAEDPAPETREGRRVRAEKLAAVTDAVKALTGAGKTIGDFVTWAGENLRADSSAPDHRLLMPDADFGAELRDRWGTDPNADLMAEMNEKKLLEVIYAAGYTFLDIVVANVQAEPGDVTQEQRLTNVQQALNEFGQIVAGVIGQVAPGNAPRSSGAATGNDVKPNSAGGATNAPSDGSAPEARAAVTETLDAIAAALQRGADAQEMQGLLEDLTDDLRRCVPAPEPAGDGQNQNVLVAILGKLQTIQDRMDAPAEPAPGDGEDRSGGPPAAPPRRKGFTPRLDTDVLSQRRHASRPGQYGWSPEQFAHGEHRRGQSDLRA